MPAEIILTREDANSDSALLVEWLAGDREEVRRGQPICLIETSKASIEILSPETGILCHRAHAGSELPIGATLAAIAASKEEAAAIREAFEPERPSEQGRVTRRAAELAAANGIDLTGLRKEGFVTVADVEALIAERGPGSESGFSLRLDDVTVPDVYTDDDVRKGVLDPAFLAELRADPSAFAALPSTEKCARYRAHGATIGDGVVLGTAAYTIAPRIVIEDNVALGDHCSIECGEVVAIGAMTQIGARSEIRCRRAYIGRGSYLARGVRIGGGGNRDPQALLVLGDLAYVGDEAFLNAGRPIVAGAEVFITMRSAIITHNIGHSVLEGYENRFAPVVIEDRAQIGVGTVIYAGCRIGKGAIVASNSYVVTDIPPDKLAIGVPARVSGNARTMLSRARVWELAEAIVDELRELIVLNGHTVEPLSTDARHGFTVDLGATVGHVILVERADETILRGDGNETVVLALATVAEPPAGIAVLDLLGRRVHGQGGVLLETAREFCRKRGIRFGPEPWRYRGGLI